MTSDTQDKLTTIEQLIDIYGKLPTDANKRRIMALIKSDREANPTVADEFKFIPRYEHAADPGDVRQTFYFNRFEVINHLSDGAGREITVWKDEPFHIELSHQDDGRTLKVFLTEEESNNA